MAALSCYQPCRSHLAQPARCLDEEDCRQTSATLSLRRQQFIERCHEARGVRHRDIIPEVSVKKTREELAKHASQTLPLNRRLNVESGWSKVEEVRKKFEGVATATSFSRSFESPPRRRLADSLFASFKLPRKKDGMSAPRSLAPQPQQKRKSAVELLAETKAFYVKSETVLDRKQELPLRMSSGLGQAIAAGGCHLVSSGTLNNDACCNPYATTRSISSTRRAVSAGEGLQNTLRRLLEHADSRENVYSPAYVSHKIYADTRRLKDSYPEREHVRSQHNSGTYSGTFSGTSSSGTSGSKAHKSDPDHREKINRPLSFGDARVFFPESFIIPRQRPSEVVIKTSSHSSPQNIELPEPVMSGEGSPAEQLGAISPPAQYAHSAPRYVRSNSHSQPSVREEDSCNINSHKSLPDLHTQTRCYPEHMNTSEIHTMGSMGRSPRRRRHSGHQRTASCSSKGTRSNHSSLLSSCEAFSEHPSPGDDNYHSYNSRCGSSFARDSGGSSGHYTQRSAPPHAHAHAHAHARAMRTDSGSSTQHDQASRYNSYYPEYGRGGGAEGELECYVSAPPQFQDGAPSPPPPPPPPHPPHPLPPAPHAHHPPVYSAQPTVGIHFQASAPPPQFQDEPPMYDYRDYECTYKAPLKCLTVGRKEYSSRDYNRYHEPSTELISKQPQYQEVRMRPRADDTQEYVNTTQICPPEEVTSPLGTFKRQRCLRYKQRRPRPILRSKSDISDRYRRTDGRSPASAPCEGEDSPDSPSEESTRLQHFFERLGLDARQYEALVRDSASESPVFFSSASTVDSNQLAAAADYTVQGPTVQKQIYRNTEPPSVVERNARIIKWLCQCRKTQMQQPQ
ncbi:serine/arginine repetitive matrix protein 1 isoform X2 [Galleria mellonella]|uniref:Serine/arginine repetitive matrix protein 1 isoform X2 n=1 Tax=Galleria mellonella TaxID=7137 RepID=A0A6J3CA33_GALME|nr:serine/arginine repetitive matrix protein 1 isoform X2 [Galleria mellonella]